jgi:hypothetical protein
LPGKRDSVPRSSDEALRNGGGSDAPPMAAQHQALVRDLSVRSRSQHQLALDLPQLRLGGRARAQQFEPQPQRSRPSRCWQPGERVRIQRRRRSAVRGKTGSRRPCSPLRALPWAPAERSRVEFRVDGVRVDARAAQVDARQRLDRGARLVEPQAQAEQIVAKGRSHRVHHRQHPMPEGVAQQRRIFVAGILDPAQAMALRVGSEFGA